MSQRRIKMITLHFYFYIISKIVPKKEKPLGLVDDEP